MLPHLTAQTHPFISYPHAPPHLDPNDPLPLPSHDQLPVMSPTVSLTGTISSGIPYFPPALTNNDRIGTLEQAVSTLQKQVAILLMAMGRNEMPMGSGAGGSINVSGSVPRASAFSPRSARRKSGTRSRSTTDLHTPSTNTNTNPNTNTDNNAALVPVPPSQPQIPSPRTRNNGTAHHNTHTPRVPLDTHTHTIAFHSPAHRTTRTPHPPLNTTHNNQATSPPRNHIHAHMSHMTHNHTHVPSPPMQSRTLHHRPHPSSLPSSTMPSRSPSPTLQSQQIYIPSDPQNVHPSHASRPPHSSEVDCQLSPVPPVYPTPLSHPPGSVIPWSTSASSSLPLPSPSNPLYVRSKSGDMDVVVSMRDIGGDLSNDDGADKKRGKSHKKEKRASKREDIITPLVPSNAPHYDVMGLASATKSMPHSSDDEDAGEGDKKEIDIESGGYISEGKRNMKREKEKEKARERKEARRLRKEREKERYARSCQVQGCDTIRSSGSRYCSFHNQPSAVLHNPNARRQASMVMSSASPVTYTTVVQVMGAQR